MSKEQKESQIVQPSKTKVKKEHRNWYKDRYSFITIQRNVLAALTFAMSVSIVVGLIYIYKISQMKSIEPILIEIDERTGIPSVVDQVTKEKYTSDEIMRKYFIYKYIKAREGYDIATYRYNYYTVVRLLSATRVFNSFYAKVSTRNENSPVNLYGRDLRLVPQIKSMQPIGGDGNTMQVRFLVKHMRGNLQQKTEDKIAIIKFDFVNMDLNQIEVLENPLGFQVVQYNVDNDFVGR